jgi:hypothetical protein
MFCPLHRGHRRVGKEGLLWLKRRKWTWIKALGFYMFPK